MWKKIAPLLIVLSVALNVAVAGVWAAHAVRTRWNAPDRCGHGDGSDGGDGVWCPLHRKLDVTDEQWRRIEPRMKEFRSSSQAVCAEVQRLRGEMIDLLGADEPDRQAIATKQEQILAGQRRVQQLVIEQLLGEKEALTARQQKELFELLRKRSGCAGHPMMGLSDGGSGPAAVTTSHPSAE